MAPLRRRIVIAAADETAGALARRVGRNVLRRVTTHSQGSNDCATVMHTLAQFGLDYLDDPSQPNLARIANAIDRSL